MPSWDSSGRRGTFCALRLNTESSCRGRVLYPARCSDDLSSVGFAAASLISVAAVFCLQLNTFVPPVSAWKVDDPQNWVDLVALEDNRACCGTPGNSLANAGQPRFGGGCNLKSCTISAAASFSSRDCAPAAPKGSTPGAVSH